MISLTYLKLIVTKADQMRISDWIAFLSNKVIPALEQADANGDGSLSLRELYAMIKRLLVSVIA